MAKSASFLRNLGLAAFATATLNGCYYGDVYGSSSYATYDCAARYGDEYWSNDPYAYDDATYGYDCYDAADYHAGFAQIGFGGGWHQNLYYPGYGLFLFDRYGRRHSMSHDYLTYWGGRRAWYKHHGRRHHDRGRDHHRTDRPDYRDSGWRPGKGRGDGSGATPPPGFPGGRRDGGWTPPPAKERSVAATPRDPRSSAPPPSNGRSAATPRSAPPPRAAPAPSAPPTARSAAPPRDGGGGRVRED